MQHDRRNRIPPTVFTHSAIKRFIDRANVTRASKSVENRRTGTPRAAKAKRRYTSNIKIVGFGESEDGRRFVRLRITAVGKKESVVVPLDGLASTGAEAFDLLNLQRAHLISLRSRQELIDRIQGVGYRPPKFRVANRLGWHGLSFVLPDGRVPACHRSALHPAWQRPARTLRSLSGWRHVQRLEKVCEAGRGQFSVDLGCLHRPGGHCWPHTRN
jgi:acylphosphatase